MARGRMLSKSLSSSRRFAALFDVIPDMAEFAQSLYPLILSHTDDFGRMSGDAWSVKFEAHPASPRSVSEFDKALDALGKVGLIERYDSDNGKCLSITQFEPHQTGLHKRTHSRFPEPPGNSRKFPEIPSELKGTEGKGREENGTGMSLPPGEVIKARPLTVEEVFGPSDAEPDAAAEHVAAVVDAWTAEYAACRNGAIFRPHPVRDYAMFKELADTYQDIAHLRAMFRFFFLASDLPEWAATRSPRCFLKLAPETDAAVRAQR